MGSRSHGPHGVKGSLNSVTQRAMPGTGRHDLFIAETTVKTNPPLGRLQCYSITSKLSKSHINLYEIKIKNKVYWLPCLLYSILFTLRVE